MQRKRRLTNRVRNLIAASSLTAILLSVSTYAWFIGMRTVNVSSFDVKIASTESLLLSLNGKDWKQTIEISEDDLEKVIGDTEHPSPFYEGHTNSWGQQGLFPVSSVGEMDTTASRMKLFEKASLTASPGGYRLMASRVNNYDEGKTEQAGYVAFDLFVKNFTGNQYIKNLNVYDEEAIYLTVDSEVKVAVGGVENTGIENSVRVAFAQIGRVIGTEDRQNVITGITCESELDEDDNVIGDVTGICRTAQIWEPNDRDHVQNAINWYERSCKARKTAGDNITDPESFDGSCSKVVNGLDYPTYAVRKEIAHSDNIDVYDGIAYNGYIKNIKTTENDKPLEEYFYFTDTMKLQPGTNRDAFMTLAPNSITKVRVYVYIEGQDIDNYDFASIGKKISVNFGFTKERYTETDVGHEGPDVNQGLGPNGEDLTAPIITLEGESIIEVDLNPSDPNAYTDEGIKEVIDNVDGDITDSEDKVVTSGRVDTSVAGTYKIVYKATDTAGNVGVRVRTVIVK